MLVDSGEVGEGGEPIMARLLTHLAYHGSPLMFPIRPQRTIPPEIHQHRRHLVAYIPRWRGEARWQRVQVLRDLQVMK